MGFTASREKVSSQVETSTESDSNVQLQKRKRRTKGPSEKIRSLAALSLSAKVGYLNLSDLVGDENSKLGTFAEGLPRLVFKRGERIFPPDGAQSGLFLLKSGAVNISRPSALGRQFSIKRVEPGTMFGEMPLLGQSLLGAQAIAAEDSEVVLINEADFEKIVAAQPEIALNLLRQLGPRLVEAERRHEQAAFQPVTARIASLLIRLANDANQVIGYTHQELADILGVYRETVTNALAELKQDRLIQIGRKKITLLNPEALLRLESL